MTSEKKKLPRLIEYLCSNENDLEKAAEFLRSGPDAQNNFSEKLNPELFFTHFYVNAPDDKNETVKNEFKKFLKQNNNYIFVLRGSAGSGKTVFLHKMLYDFNPSDKSNPYGPVQIDFAVTASELRNTVANCVRKAYCSLCVPNRAPYRNKLKEIAERIQQLNQEQSGYEIYRPLSKAMKALEPPSENRSDEYERKASYWINQRSEEAYRQENEEAFHGRSMRGRAVSAQLDYLWELIALYILIRYSNSHNEKLVIIFDNIEALTINDASIISRKLRALTEALSSIINIDNMKKFIKLIVLARTTTEISIENGHVAGQRVGIAATETELKYYDFTALALLKKIYFMSNVAKMNIASPFFSFCSLLAHVIIPSFHIENAISGILPLDIKHIIHKYYTDKVLAPFFGFNFRCLIDTLSDILLDKKSLASSLIYDPNGQVDVRINGARMIIIYEIFRRFAFLDNVFENMGVNSIFGIEKSSPTRIMLAYLYWDEYIERERLGRKKYLGMPIRRLVEHMQFSGLENDEIAKEIYAASAFSSNDHSKKQALGYWSNLIDIHLINEPLTLDNVSERIANSNSDLMNTALIELAPAGLVFTQYAAVQFELFNARRASSENERKATSLFDLVDAKEETDDEYSYVLIINDILADIENLLNNTFDVLNKSCKKTQETGNRCPINEDQSFWRCSFYVHFQQMAWLITDCMDYIDRFRIYLVDISIINDASAVALEHHYKLLKLIECYANLEVKLNDKLALSCSAQNVKELFSTYSSRKSPPSKWEVEMRSPYNAYTNHLSRRGTLKDYIDTLSRYLNEVQNNWQQLVLNHPELLTSLRETDPYNEEKFGLFKEYSALYARIIGGKTQPAQEVENNQK